MSRHEIKEEDRTIVFGWDQPLMSYFLQIHAHGLPEDDNPVIWLGADAGTSIYELDHLIKLLNNVGVHLDREMQGVLYLDKDEGR